MHTQTTAQQQHKLPLGIRLHLLMLRWKSRSHFFKRQHRYVHTLLLSTGVILVWRGLWGLMDILLLPAWPITSMIVSIVLGVIVLFIDDFELDELH